LTPHAKLHAAVFAKFGIASLELVLSRYRTLHGVHNTYKLGQYIVAWRVDDPAPVLLDKLGHYGTVDGKGLDSLCIVFSHKAAVARYVSA